MKALRVATLAGFGMTALACAPRAGTLPSASTIAPGPETHVPWGWIELCGRQSSECQVDVQPAVDIHLTQNVWATLNDINRKVNREIKLVPDEEHWGSPADRWDYPTDGKGESKAYAIWKRKLLRDLGLPRQGLLLTVVRDPKGAKQVVLTVKTDRGEFILDNTRSDIRGMEATGYQPVKRQSQTDPNLWVSIEPEASLKDVEGTPVPLLTGLTWGMSKGDAIRQGFAPSPQKPGSTESLLGKPSFRIGDLDFRLYLDFDEEGPADYRRYRGLNYIWAVRDDCKEGDVKSLKDRLSKMLVSGGVIFAEGKAIELAIYRQPKTIGHVAVTNECLFGLRFTIHHNK